jgi:hypothetical protein
MPTDTKKTADEIAEEAVAEATKEEVVPEKEPETTPTVDPAEASAKAQGWKPKDQFTGDPALWVDAKEFLGRAPLFDKIKAQSTELKGIKKTVDAMAKHFEKNLEHAVNAKISELKAAKKEAIEGGDVAKVEAIDKAIEEQKATKADIPKAPEVAPEVTEWVSANPWYTKDQELHDFALAYNDSYLKRNPGDLEGSLKATATATKKAFPEKFLVEVKVSPAASAAPTVEGGTAPSKEAKKYSVDRLSAEQKMVYSQIVKKHNVVSHDQFFKDLESIGELK